MQCQKEARNLKFLIHEEERLKRDCSICEENKCVDQLSENQVFPGCS